ncbi:MAG: HlyD family efflux transporter periplasmic adaptor subunit [Pirellulales bacterium]
MTATDTQAAAPKPAPPSDTETDVCLELLELAASDAQPARRYRRLLNCVAEHFEARFGAVEISTSTASVSATFGDEQTTSDHTKQALRAAVLEAETEGRSVGRVYHFPKTGEVCGVLALPVPSPDGGNCGALGLVVPGDSQWLVDAQLAELRALLWLLTARQKRPSKSDPTAVDPAAARAMSRASAYESWHHMAFALANRLKERFGCEQASVGGVRRGRVRVAAISGMDDLHPRTPGTIRIRQAMEECLDRRGVVCVQRVAKGDGVAESTGHRLHKQWSDAVGGGCVLSFPIQLGDEIVAVVSLLRDARRPFSDDDVKQLGELLTPLGGAIRLVERSSRNLPHHMIDVLHAAVHAIREPGRWPRRVALAVGVLAALWFCFGRMDYVITVPCRIAPAASFVMSAPFEGRIALAAVDVGDDVAVGDVLYAMDTRKLTLEQERLRSEIAVARLRHGQALTEGDRLEASLAAADTRVLEADLAVIDHKLSEATVRAPSAGTVLSGSVQDHVGDFVPVGAPLVELAAREDWRLELNVPDALVGVVEPGEDGWFVCNARPEEQYDCRVELVHPAAQAERGQSTFVVEAQAGERPDWMRVGMEGVARIDTGRRPVWWVYLHRAIDFVRLHVWV